MSLAGPVVPDSLRAKADADLGWTISSNVTIEAGSWISVVDANVTMTTAAARCRDPGTGALAVVSARARERSAVLSVKVSSATARAIEAITSRLPGGQDCRRVLSSRRWRTGG